MSKSANSSGSQQDSGLIRVSPARRRNMERGVADLRQWIDDILDVGIWQLSEQGDAVGRMAERLVDAQLGSIAKRIRMADENVGTGIAWAEEWLALLGTLKKFTDLFARINELPALLAADVWQYAGVFMKKKDVLALKPVMDRWLVLGMHKSSEERLIARKTWLFGLENRRWAMLLDYGMNVRDMPKVPPVGREWKAALCFYPSSTGYRALVANGEAQRDWNGPQLGFDTWEDFYAYQHQIIMKNPLPSLLPCVMKEVEVHVDDGSQYIIDVNGGSVQLGEVSIFGEEWEAICAGGRFSIFGEVKAQRFDPWSVYTQGRLIPVK